MDETKLNIKNEINTAKQFISDVLGANNENISQV